MSGSERMEELKEENRYLRETLTAITRPHPMDYPTLTPSQARIVNTLKAAKGKVVTYQALEHALYWDQPNGGSDYFCIKVMVSQLRRRDPTIGRQIKTRHGIGYYMESADEE